MHAAKDNVSTRVTNFFRYNLLWLGYRLGISLGSRIRKHRIRLSKRLDHAFDATVRYGPFAGLRLAPANVWNSADRGSMLLGMYEQEVLSSLRDIPAGHDTLIDLGAADGYYGVGVLVGDLFRNAICYESNELGRAVIRSNAILNGVQDRIEIRGMAEKHFHEAIPAAVRDASVLLVDVEGGEFELLHEATFRAFAKAIILVELHEWFFEDGAEKLSRLMRDSASTHSATTLTMGARDPSAFPELHGFNDNDRWLVCSEGRGRLMRWLRFDPR